MFITSTPSPSSYFKRECLTYWSKTETKICYKIVKQNAYLFSYHKIISFVTSFSIFYFVFFTVSVFTFSLSLSLLLSILPHSCYRSIVVSISALLGFRKLFTYFKSFHSRPTSPPIGACIFSLAFKQTHHSHIRFITLCSFASY